MVDQATVQQVVESHLCMGCGVCAGLCPIQAISMVLTQSGTYEARISEDKCVHCGVCLTVCPGHEVDFDGLEQSILSEVSCSAPLLGRYEATFIGHSLDANVRMGASSGGVITSLLIHALQAGKVEGAIVTRASADDSLKAEAFLALTIEDIVLAKGSKYCPVTVGTCLREVLQSSRKFAFVGLPCHIAGLRKAQQEYPDLGERIPLVIGLFCSRVPTLQGTRFMLESFQVDITKIKSLSYRGAGWPGTVRVGKKNGAVVTLGAFPEVWSEFFGCDHFTPNRCLLCPDPLAELADVSCGDPWLSEYHDERKGNSVVIVRSKAGMELLREAMRADRIVLSPISPERVIASQASGLRRKRRNLKARFWFANRIIGQHLPAYGNAKLSALVPTRGAYLFVWLPYLSVFIGRHRFLRGVWWKLPSFIRKMYRRLYSRVV